MQTKTLITGATGIVGRALTIKALESGLYVAILVRAENNISAVERLNKCLGHSFKQYEQQIEVFVADLLKPNFGLSKSNLNKLKKETVTILHCAGDVSFNDQNRDRIFQTNVKGTHHILDFATACEFLKVFVHVSTAYVCGDYEGKVFEDQLDYGQEFSTPYEESKFHAELLVQLFKQQSKLPTIIVRPSIILESIEGLERTRIPAINSLIILLAEIIRSVDKTGINQSLRLPSRHDSIVDLVPIGYVVDSILKLSVNKLAYGKTFHLTNSDSFDLQQTLTILNEEIGIGLCQIKCTEPENLTFAELTKFEKMLCLNIQPYLPHLLTKNYFDTKNANAMIRDGLMQPCPPVTKDFLLKSIQESVEYANR